MTKLFRKAIEQIEKLPEGEQNAAAGALMDYLDHMHGLQLTDEQVAEVRRRRADPNHSTIPVAEVRDRLRRHGA
jgi:putative addiction module component (TIGR02574 family)